MSFDSLVTLYGDHQRMMQLSFAEQEIRQLRPEDVAKLADVELAGLMYWIEKQEPYGSLSNQDKQILLQRYSVRKLSLDHYYSAAKHPQYVARGEFVMNNYTFVPNNRTGFELPDDDDYQIEAKRECFSGTFKKFWSNIIHPFVEMKVTDADMVFLHSMLRWSSSHNEHETEETRRIMKYRRDWSINSLFNYYITHRIEQPSQRLGQLILLIGELEHICELHCEDFIVAKLFDFGEQEKFWYHTLVYAPINAASKCDDGQLLEDVKKLNAISVMEQFNEEEDKENQPVGKKSINKELANVDPALLVFNAHMLPNVLAPLPDDQCYKNLSLFL